MNILFLIANMIFILSMNPLNGKSVLRMNENIIGSVSSTVAVTAIAAYLTGGIGAGSAAAGGSAAIVAAFTDLDNACDNADYYFGRVEFAPY